MRAWIGCLLLVALLTTAGEAEEDTPVPSELLTVAEASDFKRTSKFKQDVNALVNRLVFAQSSTWTRFDVRQDPRGQADGRASKVARNLPAIRPRTWACGRSSW